ncbi:hypothetical protein CAOG_02486 [Capsaspora owczarzaki ATCC 30864]|uniref:Small ribosomal subunit protein mS23 n=1 Tax=Capsaspora owczarzaki (strain ATCC 30864) TaxID=595528 RepID=A0A0D2X1S8_CAPO3|nr:hypothetical protein CAOG_02486 [Capsaspora owczarzaki ATCC 30864]KJE91334.1 hypothetical protein CAOG_002486 [Capsaspora owczarzaki ATCC 30864]|eukprot:XP_004349236.1 hypothetical protein CAOG_02486 [Capsaspora owczarzaki ATCC 30864]
MQHKVRAAVRALRSPAAILERVNRLVVSDAVSRPGWFNVVERIPPPQHAHRPSPAPPKIVFPEDGLRRSARRIRGEGVDIVGILPSIQMNESHKFTVKTDGDRITQEYTRLRKEEKLSHPEALARAIPESHRGTYLQRYVAAVRKIREANATEFKLMGAAAPDMGPQPTPPAVPALLESKAFLPYVDSLFASRARNDPRRRSALFNSASQRRQSPIHLRGSQTRNPFDPFNAKDQPTIGGRS